MSGLTRRTQILLDEDRHARLEAYASGAGRSVASVIREAIDEKLSALGDDAARQRAARSLLDAAVPDYDVEPDWATLKREMRDSAGAAP